MLHFRDLRRCLERRRRRQRRRRRRPGNRHQQVQQVSFRDGLKPSQGSKLDDKGGKLRNPFKLF